MTDTFRTLAAVSTPGRRSPQTLVRLRRRAVAVSVVAVASLLLGGCGKTATQAAVTPPAVTATPAVAASKVAPPKPDVPAVWPLTGVATNALVERPALAIKIENPREARPQTGLEFADMVWEEVVEGGVTRLAAVFHSNIPGEVGPVRSVRPMDPAITAPLKGLVVFSGGAAPFVAAVRAAGLQVISQDTGNAGFFRTKDRPAPHNLHGTPSTFLNQADANHQASPPRQFSFARTAALGTAVALGAPATAVNVRMSGYSQPGWTWSAPGNAWLRSEGGTPDTTTSGARVSAQNVVILQVPVVTTGYVDVAGNPVPETKLVGTGNGLLATGGKTIAITWSKASIDAPVTLAASGAPTALLAPGTTWIELVPIGTGSFSVS
jgi:hypothetical protein